LGNDFVSTFLFQKIFYAGVLDLETIISVVNRSFNVNVYLDLDKHFKRLRQLSRTFPSRFRSREFSDN
jgi:hypothetical protein